jgi:ubiquinone/menaquinone biosynthesis C-methylase UbiE
VKIQPGQTLLDVECGPASDTIQLAQLVGAGGRVFSIDYDQTMINEAGKRAEKAGVSAWVTHQRAGSDSLPFDVKFSDANGSERLFQHFLEPTRALSEMTRVIKRDGDRLSFYPVGGAPRRNRTDCTGFRNDHPG